MILSYGFIQANKNIKAKILYHSGLLPEPLILWYIPHLQIWFAR